MGEVQLEVNYLRVKSSLIFITTLLMLISCGKPSTTNPEDKSLLFASPILEGGSPFADREQGIAYRVCFALRAKRFHYHSSDAPEEAKLFTFQNTIRQCDNSEEIRDDIEVKFRKNNDDIEYAYQNMTKLFYGPLTDTQGLLAPVCEKILKGETSTNVFVSEQSAYEVTFFSQLNGDGVLIKFGEVNPENEFQFKSSLAHYYYVLTDTTVSGDMLGIIHKAEEVKLCDNGLKQIETVSSKDL